MANEGLNTLGWVSIIAGAVIIRFATRGRGLSQIPGDVSDLTIAAVSGGDVAEVLSRRSSVDDGTTNAANGDPNAISAGAGNPGVLSAAKSLGSRAKGYKLGATGPDYYDCSGLVWQALKANGYSGARFTTATFGGTPGFTRVNAPQAGDIVIWPIQSKVGHMGVAEDATHVYSALSPQSGIKSLPISTLDAQKGYAASFWRWDGKA